MGPGVVDSELEFDIGGIVLADKVICGVNAFGNLGHMVRFSSGIPCDVIQPAGAVFCAVTDSGNRCDFERIIESNDVALYPSLGAVTVYGEGACAGQVEGNVVAGLVADPVDAVLDNLELYVLHSSVNGVILGPYAVACTHGVVDVGAVPGGAEDRSSITCYDVGITCRSLGLDGSLSCGSLGSGSFGLDGSLSCGSLGGSGSFGLGSFGLDGSLGLGSLGALYLGGTLVAVEAYVNTFTGYAAVPVVGVQAVLVGRDIIIAVFHNAAVAAVAVVVIPVTTAGQLVREGALVNLIGIYDKDTSVEVHLVVGAVGDRVIVALISAFTVQIAGLRSAVVDRLFRIHAAVYAVVEDEVDGVVIAGEVSIEDRLVVVVDFHSVARP